MKLLRVEVIIPGVGELVGNHVGLSNSLKIYKDLVSVKVSE
jgi:hypothetical protein